MSAHNGNGRINPPPKPSIDDRLSRNLKRLQLIETNQKLRAYRSIRESQKKRKKLLENFDVGILPNAYSDSFDGRLGPDSDFYFPHSTANDRRYGDNFPFWRTWVEHSRLRAASRVIHGLSPLVRGAIGAVGAYVIGDGMRSRAAPKVDKCPKELLEAVQVWLDEWEKENDWLSVQQECFVRHQRDGEYFPRLFLQDDGGTLVRIVEPEHIIEPPHMPREIAAYGIITDPEDLWDTRGFFVDFNGNASTGEQVSNKYMRQHKANVDRTIKRGLPTISYDTLDFYKLAGRLLENMGVGAAIQAAIAFVRQHEIASGAAVSEFVSGLGDYSQDRLFSSQRENVRRFEAGTVVDMDAGQQFVETHFAANVQNFTSVVQALLRAIAVTWSAPEWVVSADNSSVNYASSLTAESPFVRRVKFVQTEFKSVFQWVIDSALRHRCRVKRGIRAAGRLWLYEEVLHYVDIQVTPPTVETRNRQEEASLNQTYIQMGVKSRQTVAQELGLDFEQEERNNTQYEQEHGEQGVPQKLRAGSGGGGPDDPLANIPGNHPAMAGADETGGLNPAALGVNRDGDGQPDDPAAMAALMQQGGGEEGQDEQQPGQQPQEAPQGEEFAGGADNTDDILASAGLDDLFGDLGLPEDAGAAEESAPEEPSTGNDLRATVGGADMLRELQTAVYGGELPREAAMANVQLMLGFSQSEAEKLFPDIKPKNTQDDGESEDQDDDTQHAMNAVDSVLESVNRFLEKGYTGRKKDSLGRTRCYTDGKQTACATGQHSAGSQDPARDEANAHVSRVMRDPASATTEDLRSLAGTLANLTASEVHQIKKAFGLRAGGTKPQLIEKVSKEAARLVKERQSWARKARAANVEPRELFATARQFHHHATDFQKQVKGMLADARKTYQKITGKSLNRNHKAFRGGDYTDLQSFESVARSMADRYPELLGAHGYSRGDNDSAAAAEALYDFLYAGTPRIPKRSTAYSEALDHLAKSRDMFRDQDEVPF